MPDGQRVLTTLHGLGAGPDQFTEWMVPLEAGRCYWFGYAADPGVERFSFYIWDPANHRADTERNRPGQGVVSYCPTVNGMHRLQGKAASGAGHFAVVAYAKQGAVPAPPLDLVATIEAQAAAAAPGAARIGEFYSGSAETSDWVTAMEAGKCYWIIGQASRARSKALFVPLGPRNSRRQESRSDSRTSMVGYCAREPGMYKFQAKVYSGSGPYKVGVPSGSRAHLEAVS